MTHTSNPVSEDAPDKETIRRLVQRARSGDEESFGELVKTYHQRLYSLAYGLAGNPDDAREIVQQTWIKAWQKLGSFKEDSEFFTWVYRVASNTGLDYLRRRARRREDELPPGGEWPADARMAQAASQSPRPDREAERAELMAVFEETLDELSPEHRLAITLREVDGLSYEEIADVMKCRKGTVMSRIFYARRRLQERLRELL